MKNTKEKVLNLLRKNPIIGVVISILALWVSLASFSYSINNGYILLSMLYVFLGLAFGQIFILSLNNMKKKELLK